jgi:hypothetical protein
MIRGIDAVLFGVMLGYACGSSVVRAQAVEGQGAVAGAADKNLHITIVVPHDRSDAVLQWLSDRSGVTVVRTATDKTVTLEVDWPLSADAFKLHQKLSEIAGPQALILPELVEKPETSTKPSEKADSGTCTAEKYETKCVARTCRCDDYDRSWHYAVGGIMPRFSGAIRGYNHRTLDILGQVGFKDMAAEIGFGWMLLKIQSLPDVEYHSFVPAYALDGRVLFYGNSRHRAAFFIGGGLTWVPRGTIRDIDNPADSVRDPRVQWWIRSPLGIEARFAVLDDPDFMGFGRAFMEPWFPVGRFENEVTVMFGIGIGVYLGARNPSIPYEK